ncbi:MAG: FUSC family protein [Flavobacteriaceae bacterium]|nr:FUSC family protein [Bacteroidia bacterium]NNK82155.1 FUSC family protein [Flavobacteriaceae bacterium]
MRTILTILGILSAIIALALSILPFGKIALIPIIASFIIGFIVFQLSKKFQKSTLAVKIIFLLTIIALAFNIYNSLKPNEIIEDQEQIELDIQSEEEDIEELEDLEIE